MQTALITQTKRFTYITTDGATYRTNTQWEDKNFEKVEDLEFQTFDCKIECEGVADAYYKYVGHLIQERNKRKIQAEKCAKIREAELQRLLSMSVIPATVENISKVLEHLNTKNWGSWTLPRMSIGYRAAQYDVEGKTVTTIVLSKKIDFCGKKEHKFKSGSKRGHLEKYAAV